MAIEVSRNLIRAIQKAGITVDPSHRAFRAVAERLHAIIDEQAKEAHEVTRKREGVLRNLLTAEVGETALGILYTEVEPDRIHGCIDVFSLAIRRKASEIITEQRRLKYGEADAPPPKVHERKPIKGIKGRRKF
jgi:hypothetical protein